MRRARLTVLACAVLLAGATACGTGPGGGSSGESPAAPGGSEPAGDPGKRLDGLTVAPRGSMDGYDRDKYPHWISQGDGCDTREAVLKRDGDGVETGSDCYPERGSWTSPYDGEKWTDPSDVDIDHVVPLAHSWISGADEWTDEERRTFANDLKGKQLLAVTDNVNQEKSDKAPDQWRPPLKSYWCRYASDWIDVKHQYELTVTESEKAALRKMLARC
ncbi:HNH endonuclease family protein [Streptomyces sp. HNM0574]|uniref:HNH endonuclease family protein n=1 Tax=Streptomyces sp. HNM0574 TaxID=2714954 RepID=UPI00146E9BBA|nr:HNH endonuclease family protein [Streptomyces sp. HNM0574]NLU70524.1 HNH endonuclease [Streptomyces sp. HNM0574]